MDKFGVEPIQSIESFGVAGVLGRRSQIFYNPFFDTKHLGRTCDLIIAQLRPAMIDEINFRTLFYLSILYGFSSQFFDEVDGIERVISQRSNDMGEPLFTECGIDLEKIAISVNFRIHDKVAMQVKGLPDRIFQEKPENSFEGALVNLQRYAHRMVFKFVPESRRAELVTIIALNGKISEQEVKEKRPLSLVLLEKSKVGSLSKPEGYINLGELDHQSLLERNSKEEKFRPKRENYVLINTDQSQSVDAGTALLNSSIREDQLLDATLGVSSGENAGVSAAAEEATALSELMGEEQSSKNTSGEPKKYTNNIVKWFNRITNKTEDNEFNNAPTDDGSSSKVSEIVYKRKETLLINKVKKLESEVEKRTKRALKYEEDIKSLQSKLVKTIHSSERFKALYNKGNNSNESEIDHLNKKIEVLENQLADAQIKANSSNLAEYSVLKVKFNRLLQQYEEEKTMHRDLVGKSSEISNIDDEHILKSRLDSANSLIVQSQREIERLREQIEVFRKREGSFESESKNLENKAD